MKVEVHFLGYPEIVIEKNKIQITQKKIEAMLLYILFNGKCTREELVAMFWCDCDEEGARRNLRNSLYKIRNLIGKDFLLTSGKSYITLNPQLEIERDTDLFVMENSEIKIIELTNFCFLDKIFIRNCPEFEEWVRSMQNTYERILSEKLIPAMRLSLQKGSNVLAEKYAECILHVDIHNEEAMFALMKICEQSGNYNRAVLIYNGFMEKLHDDLGLEPGIHIKEEYENILHLKTERRRTESRGPHYPGHIRAMAALEEEYSKYQREISYDTCILCGEEGMCKKDIWWEFTKEKENNKENVINFWLVQSGSYVEYYAIRQILLRIGEWIGLPQIDILNGKQMENADLFFMNIIDKLADRMQNHVKKSSLIIHNLEFADIKSMNLILTCLRERMKQKLFVAAVFNRTFEMRFPIFSCLNTFPGVRLITMDPLAEGECSRYFMECIPEGKSAKPEERKLYQYTGGNLRLLQETATNFLNGFDNIYFMRPQLEQRFESMFKFFSEREYQYMEYLAILKNGAEIEALSSICQETCFSVTQELNHLLNSNLLEEINQRGHERIKIHSEMIREMLYQKMASFKQKELHKAAMQYYEELYQKPRCDLFILSELKYHAAMLDCREKALYYDVYYLGYVLDYYDEFFPAVPCDVETLRMFSISREEVYQKLEEFQSRLNMLENNANSLWCYELQMELYYLRGRTLNRDGKRDAGLFYAEKLISLAEKTEKQDMLINGYIEAICFGVKAEDPDLMEKYLEKVKKISNLASYEVEYGKLMRLEGYCCILKKEYNRAEELLKQSIRIFECPKFKNTYYYCTAGAYDYLAITYRCRKQYDSAQKAMEKALGLCNGRNMRKGMDLFYEDYAYILFLQGKHEEAEKYFCLSAQIYDEFGTYWLRSVGESCMSMIYLERGDEKEALKYFRRAEIFSRKENTKEELAILKVVRQKLKRAKILV
ncbi:MAG: tetratricopeptide repeat protein [Lachnospiraceae bacterium]